MRPRNSLGLVAALAALPACEPVPPCGDFTFTGSEWDFVGQNGVDASVSFDFDPAECGATCTCNLVAYVQIVRTVDLQDGTYLYPTSEKADRATADGWYVDRIAGMIWGYYGRNNDGTFQPYLDPGSNTDPAVLSDSPRRPGSEPWLGIWWEAVSVPVCIDGAAACNANLLGGYFWSWVVEDDGTVAGIIDGTGWEGLIPDAVDQAVVEWNAQAPGLGKNVFPAFTWMTP
jgi:hypothetical protein